MLRLFRPYPENPVPWKEEHKAFRYKKIGEAHMAVLSIEIFDMHI